MKRTDRAAIEEQRAWLLFVRRQRLAISAWKRWERASKSAERATDKELEHEARAADVHAVLREQAQLDTAAANKARGWTGADFMRAARKAGRR